MNKIYESFLEQTGSRERANIGNDSPFQMFEFSSEKGTGTTAIYELDSYARINIINHLYVSDFKYSAPSEDSIVIHQYDSILSDQSYPDGRVRSGMQYVYRTFEQKPQNYVIKKNIPAKVFGIQLSSEYYEDYLKRNFGIDHSEVERMLHKNAGELCIPEISAVMHQLMSFRGDHISAKVYYRAKIDELISLLFRNSNQCNKVPVSEADRCAILEIAEYMSRNIENTLSLPDMAAQAYMSISKFKYVFQNVLGHSFSEHLLLLRMNAACDMLLKSQMYISEIAQRVGYKDPGSFSTQFKRFIGISPGEYRTNKK